MAKTKSKKNIFKSLANFITDVKKESKKVMWTSKTNLLKYSISTLVVMVFICIFFVGTDLVIALITNVKELIG